VDRLADRVSPDDADGPAAMDSTAVNGTPVNGTPVNGIKTGSERQRADTLPPGMTLVRRCVPVETIPSPC